MSGPDRADAAGRPAAAAADAPVPRVSVLMAAWNAEATLRDAVNSVRGQSFADWELLIADDGSIDATRLIAVQFSAADPRIRVLPSDRHEGAAAARNRALSASRGRYVAFLDADDLWLPAKLEQQIAFMEATGAAFSFTGYLLRRRGAGDRVVAVPGSVSYAELLRGNVIGCLTALYDSAQCGRVPMADIVRRHDFALWLELVRRTGAARGLNLPLAVHRVSRGSLSANKLAASRDTWRMYRDVVGLSRGAALRCLVSHLWRRVTRRDARA